MCDAHSFVVHDRSNRYLCRALSKQWGWSSSGRTNADSLRVALAAVDYLWNASPHDLFWSWSPHSNAMEYSPITGQNFWLFRGTHESKPWEIVNALEYTTVIRAGTTSSVEQTSFCDLAPRGWTCKLIPTQDVLIVLMEIVMLYPSGAYSCANCTHYVLTSVAVLANISVSSPRKLIIFTTRKKNLWVKASRTYYIYFGTLNHRYSSVVFLNPR